MRMLGRNSRGGDLAGSCLSGLLWSTWKSSTRIVADDGLDLCLGALPRGSTVDRHVLGDDDDHLAVVEGDLEALEVEAVAGVAVGEGFGSAGVADVLELDVVAGDDRSAARSRLCLRSRRARGACRRV